MWNRAALIVKKTPTKIIIPKPLRLDECLNKTYVLRRSEKYNVFLGELGIEKSIKAEAIGLKPTVTLTKENDEYTLTIAYSEDKIEKFKFKIGEKVRRGSFVQSEVEVKDNRMIETQMVGSKKIVITREFRKNDLTVTMEANQVRCVRYYVVAKSKHSIATETSRRESLFETVPDSEEERTTSENVFGMRSATLENDVEDICY